MSRTDFVMLVSVTAALLATPNLEFALNALRDTCSRRESAKSAG